MINTPFQKFKTGFVLSIAFLLGSLLLSYNFSSTLQDNINRSESFYKVLHQVDKVIYAHTSCEAHIRGYLITRDGQFADEYKSSEKKLRAELYHLNGMQYSQDLDRFNQLIDRRISIMNDKLEFIESGSIDKERLNALVNKGKLVADSIVNFKNQLEKYELGLVDESNVSILSNLTYIRYVIIISVCISVLLGIFTMGIAREYIIERERKVHELNTLDQNKNKFFSLISHDIRSPSNRLVMLSKMLSDSYHNNHDKDMEEILLMTQASAIKLQTLVENLLIWGKSQMGKIDLNPVEINIHASLERTVSLMTDFAQTKNVQLVNTTDRCLMVYADMNMIDTVFRNLVHNAIKYSKENSQVRIDSFYINNLAEIRISDSGIGMDETTANKLRQMVGMVSQPGTANEQGSGLGFMICNEFIEKNGGHIKIETELNKGTTIVVTLPLFSFETLTKGNWSQAALT